MSREPPHEHNPSFGISKSSFPTTIKPTFSDSIGSSYAKPPDSGLDRSLSGSNTSLSSIKSAREPMISSINRTTFRSAYSSMLDGNSGSSNILELERAKSKIRKLEKQVSYY